MKIRVGYEMIYDFPQPTPLIAVLGTHFTRASDVIVPDHLTTSPSVPITPYRDGFGNWCSRLVAPAGRMRLAADGTVRDSGLPDVIVPSASQHAVEDLPAETIVYLLGSRYCETDRLSDIAWKLFEKTTPGWARVQAICDFVHNHIAFGYEHARATMTAWEVFNESKGVCRDYAHLAIAFCRCMNIPARYCTGYLGDIGMPPPYAAGDFAGWFEAYIGGHWYTFDARNNIPRIGRILIAQGRDAADVPITQTFGPNTLVSFKVWTDEADVKRAGFQIGAPPSGLRLTSLFGEAAATFTTSPRAPWLSSVTESIALPPQPVKGGHMSDIGKFDLREWLVPPVLMPIFFALLIAAAAIIQQ